MERHACLPVVCLGFLLICCEPAQCEHEFRLVEDDSGVNVNLDGKPFTRYVLRSGSKPILWPLIGPHGNPITRQYPMKESGPDERADHPHHRSFWFTHGDVNGISFWHEPKVGKFGIIQHRRFERISSGPVGQIVSENDWIDNSDKLHCQDRRIVTFSVHEEHPIIDFEITISAGDQPVTFGDTKEGCFGIRVAGPMKVEAAQGGKIVNREGLADADAWGKPSPWVDYSGPAVKGGPTVGIAILNHPKSFRFPTYWHVRTYGLFAANPFGLHNFKNSKDVDGSHTLQAGEKMTLAYRVLVHTGDAQTAKIDEAFERYRNTPLHTQP